MKTVTMTTMEYHELDDLVHELYGKGNYSFVASEEMNNDSSKHIGAIKHMDRAMYADDMMEASQMLSRGECPMYRTHAILLLLLEEGKVPEGEFLIEVSW